MRTRRTIGARAASAPRDVRDDRAACAGEVYVDTATRVAADVRLTVV